jgi:hypothetical protein
MFAPEPRGAQAEGAADLGGCAEGRAQEVDTLPQGGRSAEGQFGEPLFVISRVTKRVCEKILLNRSQQFFVKINMLSFFGTND